MPITRDEKREECRLFGITDIYGNRLCITGFDDGSIIMHTDNGEFDPDHSICVSASSELEQLIAFLSQVVEDGQAAENAA